MAFEDFILAVDGRAQARPLPTPPRAVVVPVEDDALTEVVDYLGDAEGQSFMIEYIDSAGRRSTRRISVYGIAVGPSGIPLLTAKCHERKKTRQFRVDRIQCCIDYSGEVYEDVAGFLSDNFGMSATAAKRKADGADARWLDIRDLIRDEAALLAAMASSDGSVHGAEALAATRHLVRLVERTGMTLSDGEVSAVGSYFQRLRPTGETVRRALDGLRRHNAERIHKTLLAAVEVLDADGLRHPDEMAFLNDICVDLTGAGLA